MHISLSATRIIPERNETIRKSELFPLYYVKAILARNS